MAYNFDFAAAINTGKLDNYSKGTGFTSSSKGVDSSFKDSLKEAFGSTRRNELNADDRTSFRKEAFDRSETRLKSYKSTEASSDMDAEPAEKSEDKQADTDPIAEQLLSKLEELASLQQQGEIPAEEYAVLLESLKEALKKLEAAQLASVNPEAASLQVKTAELVSLLEEQLTELKATGALITGNNAESIVSELKALLAGRPQEAETSLNSTNDSNSADISTKLDANVSDTKDASNEELKENRAAETTGQVQNIGKEPQAEGKAANVAGPNKNHEKKSEAAAVDIKPVNKETEPAAEENTEEVKAALDGKVEKIAVENKENERQSTEAENGREAPKDMNKLSNEVKNKFENVEAPVINAEQAAADSKIEVVQGQTLAARPTVVNKADIINQIVKKAEIVFTDTQPEIRMQLEPENLGKLTLKLAVEKGLITAKFVTESYEVKQIIESNFNDLKDLLQEKGLEVQNFSVSVRQEDKGENSSSFQQWKETVRLNGRNINRGSYEGYLEGDGIPTRIVNPYSIHNGKFDHKA